MTRVPLSSTQTPSVQHKDQTFSAPKISQFNTKNLSVQRRKPKTLVWNWGGFGGELRGFWCWTEGGVLNWEVFGVELRNFGGWKGVTLLYGTDVLNWGGVELRGTRFKQVSVKTDKKILKTFRRNFSSALRDPSIW